MFQALGSVWVAALGECILSIEQINRFLHGLIRSYYAAGQLMLDDFHQDDAHLLARLHALTGQPVAEQYASWVQTQPPGSPIAMKPRRVDPEILRDNQVVRLSALPEDLGPV